MIHFDETFRWNIWMAGNVCKFVLNMTRLVIKLLNCSTGLSNFTQTVLSGIWPEIKIVMTLKPSA